MSAHRNLSTPGLIGRHLRSGALASVLVAVLVALAVLVVSLAPRAMSRLANDELHHSIAEQSAVRRDLVGTAQFGDPLFGGNAPTTVDETFGPTSTRLNEIPSQLNEPLAALLGPPHWLIRTDQRQANPVGVAKPDAHPVLGLAIDLDWRDRVDFVEGAAPTGWTGIEPHLPSLGFGDSDDDVTPGDTPLPPIEIALSREAAEAASLKVGDRLDYRPVPLLVTGLYEPKDPSDEYWDHAPDLATGSPFVTAESGLLVYASAFIDPQTGVGLRDTLSVATLTVWYPLDATHLDYADAPLVSDQLAQVQATGRNLPSGELLKFTTRLPEAIDLVVERVTLVTALIALAISGPIGVVLAVFALGVQSVIERRRAALTLASARGAGGTQLRSLMLLEGLLISLPAAVVGAGLAAAILPANIGSASIALPVLLAAAPPILFATATSPQSLRPSRTDIRVRARGGVRWVVEAAVFGVAALSLYLLFRRGLAESSRAVGVDPLLVVTPLLLSLAVCILVLRVYPAMMLAVQRVARRRRGAVALLGSARAVRSPALGFVAALALIVGISIAVFSSALSTTVATALQNDARLSVGSDLRVDAGHLTPEVADAVAQIEGVAGVARFERVTNKSITSEGSSTTVTMFVTDIAKLGVIRPELVPPESDGHGMSVILSDDLATLAAQGGLELEGRRIGATAVRSTNAVPTIARAWVLLDTADALESGLDDFDPTSLLVGLEPGADTQEVADRVAEVVTDAQTPGGRDDVQVIATEQVLDEAFAEPVIGGLRTALLIAAITAMVLSALAVILASVAAGPTRNRLIGVLRILGISPRQVSGLIAWELAPIALTAIIAGTLLGLAELWIVMAALDLRPFLSGTVPPVPTVDGFVIAQVVVAFLAVVALAGFIAAAIGRRYSPASSVKIGAE